MSKNSAQLLKNRSFRSKSPILATLNKSSGQTLPKQTVPSQGCDACGHANPASAKVCLNCTAPLNAPCPQCHQPVAVGSKFCGQCGAPLTASPPAATPSPPAKAVAALRPPMPAALAEKIGAAAVKAANERREVTILFLDVKGFTAASHNLDSEDVYHFINEALSNLAEVVYKYEGTIDKFTGDGLMALFGAPLAHENDPERAVRAALEMQTVIQPVRDRIKEAYGFNFRIRIGVNTGPVIAGKVGNQQHMEYTVIGDTVNLASRLEKAAEPGTILVSPETYQRTRPIFTYEPTAPLTLKGVPEPVQAYRPLAVLEQPGNVRGLAGLQVPMVGRGEDLARLQEALAMVQQADERRIALISGEAGLGKSRLVAEFQTSLAQQEVKLYQAGCMAYARSRPLWVIADFVRAMLSLSEVAPINIQHDTLQRHLNQLDLDHTDIMPYLNLVLGLPQVDPAIEKRLSLMDAVMLQKQTHAALRRLLLAQAQEKTSVFIFEDLHWIDPASRDFLTYFIQTSADIPLLMILVSRRLETQTVIRVLLKIAAEIPGHLIDIPLQALPETDSRLLLDQLIHQTGSQAQTLKKEIVDRAEGNPFYVEEIIRMLIDQGGLETDEAAADKSWRITPQASTLLKNVPGTVKGLILARFDHLPEGVRRSLQRAAVLGASFPASLLQQLCDITPKTMAAHLKQLVTRQFLIEQPFRSEPGFRFQHALLQETLYSTLLKRDRRHIHTQVAQAIAHHPAWPADEKTEMLAHHYVESTTPAKATPYLITAAENAAQRCAYEVARHYYQQAIPLVPDATNGQEETYFQIRLGLGRALKYTSDFPAAIKLLTEVRQQLWASHSADNAATVTPVLVEVFRQLADIRQREGTYDEALIYLDTGRQLLGEDAPQTEPKLWRAVLDRMAWIRFRQGQLDEAKKLIQRATGGLTLENTEDPVQLASLYNTLGGIAWQQGNLDQAIEHVKGSLELHERVKYLWGKAIAYANLGVLYDAQSDWPQAVTYYQQALDLQETIGDRQNQTSSLINLGVVHTRMGDYQTAHHYLSDALTLAHQIGDSMYLAASQINLTELAILQSDYQAAVKHAEEAQRVADEIENTELQIQARRLQALILAEQNDLSQGLVLAEQALQMAQGADLSAEVANCYQSLGTLHTTAGNYELAEQHLRQAQELISDQNDPYRYGQVLLAMGHLYCAKAKKQIPGDFSARAMTIFEEAAAKFRTIGSSHFLDLTQVVMNDIQAHQHFS